jgi:hypothetical protein
MVFDSYFLLKLVHILLFVYWLGGDIGVFYSAFSVRDRSLSIDARRTALRILAWVDQIPRYCLVLMLPVGYTLALRIGVVRLPPSYMIVLWTVAVVWLWAVWAIHHYQGTALGERIRKVDLGWRFVLLFGLCFDAWQGFRGTGHLLTDWVSLKFALLAAMLFCGIMIRMLGKRRQHCRGEQTGRRRGGRGPVRRGDDRYGRRADRSERRQARGRGLPGPRRSSEARPPRRDVHPEHAGDHPRRAAPGRSCSASGCCW